MYTEIFFTRDRTSDHRMQSQNSPTEPQVHIAYKQHQINYSDHSIYNIIPLLKKENVHLYPSP